MKRGSSPGFTLLELVVALAITGLCLALVSVSLSSAFQAHERAREHLELNQALNETLARLRLYLQSAYLSPYPTAILTFETMDTNTLRAPYDALTFTTLAHTSHSLNAKEADMIEVTIFTEDERPLMTPEGEMRLRRLRLRAGGEINDRFEVEGGGVYTLAEHVTRLEFEFLGDTGEWKPEWILGDHDNNLPCLVKVTLGMRTANLSEQEASIMVPLELSKLGCRFEDERVFEDQ